MNRWWSLHAVADDLSVRNLKISNSSPISPTRNWRKKIGPREQTRMKSATATSNGDNKTSAKRLATMSKQRFQTGRGRRVNLAKKVALFLSQSIFVSSWMTIDFRRDGNAVFNKLVKVSHAEVNTMQSITKHNCIHPTTEQQLRGSKLKKLATNTIPFAQPQNKLRRAAV